ncbi:MAG: 30S ribosomal protein S12 methylthiotransferase RimO [Spirochaetaceae bacterium]
MVEHDRSFYIETLGCAKNQVDSEVMIASLESHGWTRALDAADASLIVVNTCGFIGPAKEESIDTVLSLRAEQPEARILMAGCLVQRYPDELQADLSEADAFFGNRAPERIGAFVETHPWNERRVALPSAGTFDPTAGASVPAAAEAVARRKAALSFRGSAYLKIAEGCDNRCSFCAIPLIRGPYQSRPPAELEAELRRLASDGAREVSLIAQDLASYGRDGRTPGLVSLLKRLLAADDQVRLRMLYIHPERLPRELLELCATEPRLLPYFDMPMQHADDELLRRMARTGTGAGYLSLVEEIREALPQAVLRTSLLVGFPGESEAAFERLLAFQRQAAFDWLGVFVYSPEERTPAYRHYGELVEPAAEQRKARLEEAQLPITYERLDRFVGGDMEVLIEEEVQGEELAIGRGYPHAPEVDGLVVVRTGGRRLVPGSMVSARILRRNGVDLEAWLPEEGGAR